MSTGREKLQVEALRRTAAGRRKNLSTVRSGDYDGVIAVIFTEDFGIEGAWRIPRKTAEGRFPHNPHVNGRVIRISAQLLADPSVERIELSDALLHREAGATYSK